MASCFASTGHFQEKLRPFSATVCKCNKSSSRVLANFDGDGVAALPGERAGNYCACPLPGAESGTRKATPAAPWPAAPGKEGAEARAPPHPLQGLPAPFRVSKCCFSRPGLQAPWLSPPAVTQAWPVFTREDRKGQMAHLLTTLFPSASTIHNPHGDGLIPRTSGWGCIWRGIFKRGTKVKWGP